MRIGGDNIRVDFEPAKGVFCSATPGNSGDSEGTRFRGVLPRREYPISNSQYPKMKERGE